MSTSYEHNWVAFFENAGIPSAAAETYAAMFIENRIGGDMMADLDKELLRYIGITAQGTHLYDVHDGRGRKVHKKQIRDAT